MNERVKKLELEAYNFANSIALPGNYTDAALIWYRRESFNKKFAELIVGECMKLNHDHFNDEDPYSIDSLYRQHFGFKE